MLEYKVIIPFLVKSQAKEILLVCYFSYSNYLDDSELQPPNLDSYASDKVPLIIIPKINHAEYESNDPELKSQASHKAQSMRSSIIVRTE